MELLLHLSIIIIHISSFFKVISFKNDYYFDIYCVKMNIKTDDNGIFRACPVK